MKKSKILYFLFFISLVLFLFGISASREDIKSVIIAFSLIGVVILLLTRARLDFTTKKSQQLALAYSVSKSFIFLMALLCVVFFWNAFVQPLTNLDFALFGSLFLALVLMRIFFMVEAEEYVGK
jgi:sterol desaturase/sphingolipid hydroxylase (fatty acid hydroxylase superfamily)